MEDKPISWQQLFARALRSQVELGMGEMIVNTQAAPSQDEEWAENVKMIRRITSSPDLFSAQAGAEAQPEYNSLQAHYDAICHCQLCPLGQTRNKFVYGVGDPDADLIFIGEAPGRDEDLQGEPFVGRAGQLFDRILAAIDLTREQVYIANILKCRPPNNRDPQPEEMDQCTPHLLEQIRILKPRLICALGRVAAQRLLQTSTPMGKLRGIWHDFEGIPLLVTYHPAALLRNPAYKKGTWEDMQKLKARYDKRNS
jgi:uracil-DNA glycosylase family 4